MNPQVLNKITLDTLNDSSGIEKIKKHIMKGRPHEVDKKAIEFRKHLHDLFQQAIFNEGSYNYQGDIDAGLVENIDTDKTPDLYNSDSRIWGDVTICDNPKYAAYEKLKKYKFLLSEESCLCIHTFDVRNNETECFTFFMDEGRIEEAREIQQFHSDKNSGLHYGLQAGLSIFESLKRFNDLGSTHVPVKHPILPEIELCKEAKEFESSDNGLLSSLIKENSYDSTEKDRRSFRKSANLRLDKMARDIACKSKHFKTAFRKATPESIEGAYFEAEKIVKEKYKVLSSPKPSCHGIPGDIEKVESVADTRDHVVQRFKKKIQNSKNPVFCEIVRAMEYNVNTLYPRHLDKVELLEKALEKIKDIKSEAYSVAELELKAETRKVLWDRNSLRLKKNGPCEKLLRMGKQSKVKLEVETVPFWDLAFSESLEIEIKRKVLCVVEPSHCWTPHKELKPKLKEASLVYNQFIRSQLYQEMASVSQLAANILRLVTRPRQDSSLTTSFSSNMLAIVGPGESAMNESATIPILWMSITSTDSSLWMPAKIREGDVVISNGDRLTKARLEQMVDAPRIASVAASIICTQMKGTTRDKLYACGVLASVAMSINIRDSELIDHIRYMVPNIFSDRSCAVEYIMDKYPTPLKTRLQALIYKETRKTLLEASNIAKTYYNVNIENDEIISGGGHMDIPFLGCTVNSVFDLNGIVYTAFFSCKKGLHEPRSENRKMFDKICEFEHKNVISSLIEASFNPSSYHYFDPEYIALTMYDMVDKYGNLDVWRHNFDRMDNLQKPYELQTFSSLRSSMQTVHTMSQTRMLGVKSKLNSHKYKSEYEKVNSAWETIYSDDRTRVIDHFFDCENTILEEGVHILTKCPTAGFFATWDQKRQRTGRDREVFILDPNGKVFMHNVESLFKVVCQGVPHELITLPGNKKIISMNMKGTQFFKKKNDLLEKNESFESLRMTADMTKWAPGDNVCKFIYAIAGLPFLTRCEKIWYINFLCTSIRKKVVLNSITTQTIGLLAANEFVSSEEMWSQMLGIEQENNFGKTIRFKKNTVDVRFNWLMGVLNDTSSAVHAASASMLERVLKIDYLVHHYQPDVHSDDAAADLIVTKREKPKDELASGFDQQRLMDYFPSVLIVNLSRACIKLSEKKTYLDRYRKEFVSEVDDNGMMKSYWQKQAIAAISGLSYIDFFRDLSEGASKVANLISLGGPPSVYEVTMSNVIDLSRETYSMQPGMWNDPKKFIVDTEIEELPLELGGPLDMNLIMLPFAGIKYHTFSKMMKCVLGTANVKSLDEITEEHHEVLQATDGDLFCKVWMHTTEVAVKEGLVLNRLDPGLIRFKQFSSHEKTKKLRLMEKLEGIDEETIQEALDYDPTLSFRQAESLEEQQIKLAMLIKTPSWYSSATLQSQGALKLDRMYNVKTPCCAPIVDKDSPMEKGMKTIREAISEAIEMLKSRKINLLDTYKMLKSMPFLCYLFDIEQKVQYKPIGQRLLYPVQKEAFFKNKLIDSSVIGLLQKVYTGETNHYIDWYNLDKELALVELYRNVLDEMERPQQAVALFRIFQQMQTFSSVYFVPSPRQKGYEAILGLLGNQFSDKLNYIPIQKYEPPENKIYDGLKKKYKTNLAQKASQLACFLFRIFQSESKAAEVFRKCKIEDTMVEDIVSDYMNTKEIAYAQALLGLRESLYTPKPGEIVWIVPQKKSYPNWYGGFVAYVDVGTKNHPKGVFIFGTDEFIEKIICFNPVSEYPTMKGKLTAFCAKMNWKGSLDKHIRMSQPEEGEIMTLMLFNHFGSNIQTQIRTVKGPKSGLKGLLVTQLTGGIDLPRYNFNHMSRYGLVISMIFRGEVSDVVTIKQGIYEHFDVDIPVRVDGVPVQLLWDQSWFLIASGSPIDIDHFMFHDKTRGVYLSDNKVKALKDKARHKTKSYKTDEITYEQVMEGDETNSLNLSIFSAGKSWRQQNFNIYVSYALELHSTLLTWLTLKGYLLGLSENFNFYNMRQINEISSSPKYHFKFDKDYFYSTIYDSRQLIVDPTSDDDTELPSKESDWSAGSYPDKRISGNWADIDADDDEEE